MADNYTTLLTPEAAAFDGSRRSGRLIDSRHEDDVRWQLGGKKMVPTEREDQWGLPLRISPA